MRYILPLFLSLLFSCSTSAQNYIGKQKDIDQILSNVALFSSCIMDKNTQGIVDSYTVDGKIFPDQREIMEGSEPLFKYWAPAEGYTTVLHKVTPQEIQIVKKTAYDYGIYEGKTERPDGSVSSWQGKYVIVWKKVGKDWKIYLDIWNRSPE
jgi:ketosteroid isomerase-like protein